MPVLVLINNKYCFWRLFLSPYFNYLFFVGTACMHLIFNCSIISDTHALRWILVIHIAKTIIQLFSPGCQFSIYLLLYCTSWDNVLTAQIGMTACFLSHLGSTRSTWQSVIVENITAHAMWDHAYAIRLSCRCHWQRDTHNGLVAPINVPI